VRVALFMLLLCSIASAAPDPPPEWKLAYAKVNGVAILRTAIDAEAKSGMPKTASIQRRISIEILRQGLLAAGRDPQAVAPKALDKALADARAELLKREVKLETMLARTGQTLAEFREGLRVPLCFRNHVRAALTDAKLKELYETQKLAMAGELRLSHVFVQISQKQPFEKALAKANALLKTLGKNPKAQAFAELASAQSDDPMASLTGGDLDWIRRASARTTPKAVVAAAFRHGKLGLVPNFTRTVHGLHILYISDVRLPPSATFERLRPRIALTAERLRANRVMADWREKARVEYAPDAPRKRRRSR
jgi:parvulin-like peptidyl-prolyl isomerase